MKLLSLFILLISSALITAADWPQFLGPDRNGTSTEFGWNQKWDETEPEILWQAKVGDGCAGIAVSGGRAFTVGNERGRDKVFCLDASTGKNLWTHEYSEGRSPKFYNGGPSATPTVDGEHVYTVSKTGDLFCLRAADGKVLWTKNFVKDFGGRKPDWGYAAAPLVVGETLIADPGGEGASVVAFNKNTGAVIWKSGNSGAGYSAPILDQGQVVLFQRSGLNGFDASSGKATLEVPWVTMSGVNAMLPVPYEGGYFISSGYGVGSAFVKGGKKVFATKDVLVHFQNGVREGDFLFVGSGQVNVRKCHFMCVRLSDGKVMWSERMGSAIASALLVDGKLIILSDVGELILANPDSSGFDEIGRVQILPKTCWAPPAFANHRIYARNNDGRVVCVDVSE